MLKVLLNPNQPTDVMQQPLYFPLGNLLGELPLLAKGGPVESKWKVLLVVVVVVVVIAVVVVL